MRALLIAVAAAALALAGGTAQAAPGKCPNRAKAKLAFDAGHLAYRSGEYEEAILKFQDSYGLCEKALTLLAIANAYERLGDLQAALEHLQRYRPNAEKGEQQELDNRIATLESRIEEQRKQEEAKRRQDEEARRKEAMRREEEEARRRSEAARETEGSAERPLLWAGWISAGVGAAALGGSIVTGALALSLDGDLAEACAYGSCPADREADIERLATLSTATDVLLVVGGVLTASGIAMLLIDSSGDESPSVGILLGPGGVALRGRL